jgi:hypothetical protein
MDKVHFKQGDYVEKLCICKICTAVFINMEHTLRIIIDSLVSYHLFSFPGSVQDYKMHMDIDLLKKSRSE